MEYLITKTQKTINKLEEQQPRYAPMYYILFSCFLLSYNSMISKNIPNIHSSQIVYARAIIIALINTIVTHIAKINLYGFKSDVTKKLFMRSIFGCCGTLFFYAGIKYVSISEGQVLFRTSPLWTSLMAIYYLKTEKLTKNLIIDLTLCFFGILLITQPPFLMKLLGLTYNNKQTETQLFGVILMLTAAIFSSTIQVLINTLSKEVNQLVILQYFSIISMVQSAITILFISETSSWVIPNLSELSFLLLIGITSYFSQLLMNRAYMKGNLTEISMLGQTQVVYGYIFDIMMGAKLSFLSIFGTLLIAFALLKVVLDKKKKQQSS